MHPVSFPIQDALTFFGKTRLNFHLKGFPEISYKPLLNPLNLLGGLPLILPLATIVSLRELDLKVSRYVFLE